MVLSGLAELKQLLCMQGGPRPCKGADLPRPRRKINIHAVQANHRFLRVIESVHIQYDEIAGSKIHD